MKIALDAAKFSSEEANQLRKAMATFRIRGNIETAAGQDGRADGGARLRPRFRAALLRPDQGLRRIWLPRKPRRELRAPRLCVELAQVELSGGVRVRRCSIRSRWASTPPRRSSATRASMASRCVRSMSISAIGIATWNPSRKREGRGAQRRRGGPAGSSTSLPRPLPHGGRGEHAAWPAPGRRAACRGCGAAGRAPALCVGRGIAQPRRRSGACHPAARRGRRLPLDRASTAARRYGIRARSSRRPTCPCSSMPRPATKGRRPSRRSFRRCRSPNMW